MEHVSHEVAAAATDSLTRTAVRATLHCLTGCAIGEVLGMVIATALGWGNAVSIAISVVLTFVFGYALTIGPILRAGVSAHRAAGITVASDTASIARWRRSTMRSSSRCRVRWRPVYRRPCSGGASSQPRDRFRRDCSREPVAHRAWSRSRRRASVPLIGAAG